MREIHINLGEGEEPPKTLLVPHEPDVVMPDGTQIHIKVKAEERPIVCPACKGKFSHSLALQMCVKCKLPDEIRVMGPQMIARWKRKQGEPKHRPVKAVKTKRRVKHGRRGVKR